MAAIVIPKCAVNGFASDGALLAVPVLFAALGRRTRPPR